MTYLQPILYLVAPMISGALLAESALFFREDWKESPFALPITEEHVANPQLRLRTHGPGRLGIKKSHHAEIVNDPFYVWSGKCESNWALSLKKTGFLVDLTAADAKVRWRSRQSGGHALHLVLMLPDDRWLVSDQSDAGTEWHDHEFLVSELTWRLFSASEAEAGERVEAPRLDHVAEIGFTDLKPGKGSPSSSRLDWIEVFGVALEVP